MVKNLFNEEFSREWLKSLLVSQDVTLTFVKKDGTERTMMCTLKESLIPSEKAPKNESKRVENNEVQAVFDLEKNEWRSFRWDSLKTIEFGV